MWEQEVTIVHRGIKTLGKILKQDIVKRLISAHKELGNKTHSYNE